MLDATRLSPLRRCHTLRALPWGYTSLRPADNDIRSLLRLTQTRSETSVHPQCLSYDSRKEETRQARVTGLT